MINTGSDIEFRNKVLLDEFGVNVEAEDCKALSEAIIWLYNNKKIRDVMGKNARKIAESQFDRRTSFMKIIRMITELTKGD